MESRLTGILCCVDVWLCVADAFFAHVCVCTCRGCLVLGWVGEAGYLNPHACAKKPYSRATRQLDAYIFPRTQHQLLMTHNSESEARTNTRARTCAQKKKKECSFSHNHNMTKCGKCLSAFKSMEEMLQHERIHAPDKEYACSVCNRGFTRKSNMMR